MWIYRIEKQHRRPDQKVKPRFVDIEFAPHYAMSGAHLQRLATEFRVPFVQGFTMPSSTNDSETAAIYKQLLLRPLSVRAGDEPEDVRLLHAFHPLCAMPASTCGQTEDRAGATAFSRNWLAFEECQSRDATEGRMRFLDRFEWPSAWETAEASTCCGVCGMQKAVVRTKIPKAEQIRRHVLTVEVKIPAAEQTLSIATIRASRVRR